MAIGVGINENIVLKNAEINDKKRLVVTLSIAGKKSLFEESLTAGVVSDSSDLSLQLFGPLLPKKEGMTESQKVELLMADIRGLRNKLTHILEQFMVTDSIDLAQYDVQYAGTGIDNDNFATRLLDQDVLNRIYDNLVNRFAILIKPFLNDATTPLRVKLVRQSKDKHYATMPDPGRYGNTFMEHMSVPVAQSSVKFTEAEIKAGLNDPTPTASSTAEVKSPTTGANAAAAEVNPFA